MPLLAVCRLPRGEAEAGLQDMEPLGDATIPKGVILSPFSTWTPASPKNLALARPEVLKFCPFLQDTTAPSSSRPPPLCGPLHSCLKPMPSPPLPLLQPGCPLWVPAAASPIPCPVSDPEG